MTQDEQIEQLEMEKRVLIDKLVKAQNLIRRVADNWWNEVDPVRQALRDEATKLYLELRG